MDSTAVYFVGYTVERGVSDALLVIVGKNFRHVRVVIITNNIYNGVPYIPKMVDK